MNGRSPVLARGGYPDRPADAKAAFVASEKRRKWSNGIRYAGLACFILSLVAFIIGCSFGAAAVIVAKAKVEAVAPEGEGK
jgi:hypothetical protein